MTAERSSGARNTLSLDARTVGRGAIFGAIAYAVGYLAAFTVASGKVGESVPEFVPAWKAAWWFLYNSHFSDITLSASGVISGTDTGSFVGNSTDPAVQLLYLVPPVFLIIGGALLARNVGLAGDTTEAAKAGALVVVSYLPLAVVGVFLTTHSGTSSASAGFVDASVSVEYSIQLLPAFLLTGLLYPLVFGAIGGGAASALEDRR
jgi:hypothetical membrane protein